MEQSQHEVINPNQRLLSFLIVHDNRLQVAERIKEIDEYLQQYYQDDIRLEDLAAYCHLSRSYMARFFKKHLGVTLGEYLRNIRAQRARDSLIETNDSFTSIALEHGFSGLRSMNRALESKFWEKC